jgi:hypothetical protein
MIIDDIKNKYGDEKLVRLYDMMLDWDSVTLVECLMELYSEDTIAELMSNFNDDEENEL